VYKLEKNFFCIDLSKYYIVFSLPMIFNKAEASKLRYRRWAQDSTVDPVNRRAYSYCDTAEGTKQTAHLYYWFWVTAVFLDELMELLQHVCMVCVLKNILKFYNFLSGKNQGSYASWKVLDFFLKIPGPGKSWEITLVLESPGN